MNNIDLDNVMDCHQGRAGIMCREVDDGFILYDLGPGKVHSLSWTGRR